MRTTQHDGGTLAPTPTDPLGSAARLRRARLDPDVLLARAAHVAVDLVALVLLLAVPALATLVAVALQPGAAADPLVPAVALTVAGVAVLVGFTMVWPSHDGGRTAGMRWAGLRVVDMGGGVPAPWRLVLRALLWPVDVTVGPVLVLARPDRRRLGDLLAGTLVVRDLSAGAVPAPRRGTARSPRARSRSASRPLPR